MPAEAPDSVCLEKEKWFCSSLFIFLIFNPIGLCFALAHPQVEDFKQVDIRLHNLTQKERTDRLPPRRKCLICLAHIPDSQSGPSTVPLSILHQKPFGRPCKPAWLSMLWRLDAFTGKKIWRRQQQKISQSSCDFWAITPRSLWTHFGWMSFCCWLWFLPIQAEIEEEPSRFGPAFVVA